MTAEKIIGAIYNCYNKQKNNKLEQIMKQRISADTKQLAHNEKKLKKYMQYPKI